jgi:hypothetical protein
MAATYRCRIGKCKFESKSPVAVGRHRAEKHTKEQVLEVRGSSGGGGGPGIARTRSRSAARNTVASNNNTVRHCPNCGCNIELVNHALAVSKHIGA